MDRIEERAREFARETHRDQPYGGGSFHEMHLARVAATLRRFGAAEPVLLAAGWLHDVIEDTDTTMDQLRRVFGEEVAQLVHRVTDEPGRNRRERQAATHAKIRGDPRAVRLKLADRIANVEASVEGASPLLGMYRKEYPRFREALYRPGEHEAMWRELDRLLRREGEPDAAG